MSGAWELKAANQVLVCVLHVDTVTFNWALGVRRLIIPGPDPIGIAGMPFDHARNVACQHLLQSSLQWLFFLDSDVIPPRDAILRLMSHNKPIVSGVYCRRSPPEAIPVMMKPVGNWITQIPSSGLMEVDCVGAGCLLIHRHVLEKIPPQRPQEGKSYFDWRVDCMSVKPREECLSEDFTFIQHCKKHGIPTYVDCSIRCKHVGYAESDYGSFRPMGANPLP